MISTSTQTNTVQIPLPSYKREIIIEPRRTTPFIKFNGMKGVLMIKGNATALNVHRQLMSLESLVDAYLQENNKLTCYFFFKDFNTSTCKVLFNIFKKLKRHHNLGKEIKINWFADHNDSEMLETGLDYAEIFGFRFNVQAA